MPSVNGRVFVIMDLCSSNRVISYHLVTRLVRGEDIHAVSLLVSIAEAEVSDEVDSRCGDG